MKSTERYRALADFGTFDEWASDLDNAYEVLAKK